MASFGKFLLFLVTFLHVLLFTESQHRYDGNVVYRVTPQTEKQLQFLFDLLTTGKTKVDFWKEPSVVSVFTDIRIQLEQKAWFTEQLEKLHMSYDVIIDDVQSLIDQQFVETHDHNDTRYYNLTEIYQYLEEMNLECLEGVNASCEIINIGTSYEGRDLTVIKIGRQGADRRSVFIDCGIHAREWISPATCQYIIARLVEEDTSEVTELRELFDWYIQPSVNPDGYDYTWTTDRMWRKTRKPNEGSECIGTDGNRNFEVGWAGTGSSDDPCSQTYRGTEFFSEVETKALDDFLTPIGSQFDLALTIHSYGQFFVYPWGYTTEEDPDNVRLLADVAALGEEAINAVHGTGYIGRRSNGDMAGNTIDWAMGKAGVPFTYLFELRDDGENGFLLPPDQIQPTGEEIWAGVKAMAFRISQLSAQ